MRIELWSARPSPASSPRILQPLLWTLMCSQSCTPRLRTWSPKQPMNSWWRSTTKATLPLVLSARWREDGRRRTCLVSLNSVSTNLPSTSWSAQTAIISSSATPTTNLVRIPFWATGRRSASTWRSAPLWPPIQLSKRTSTISWISCVFWRPTNATLSSLWPSMRMFVESWRSTRWCSTTETLRTLETLALNFFFLHLNLTHVWFFSSTILVSPSFFAFCYSVRLFFSRTWLLSVRILPVSISAFLVCLLFFFLLSALLCRLSFLGLGRYQFGILPVWLSAIFRFCVCYSVSVFLCVFLPTMSWSTSSV